MVTPVCKSNDKWSIQEAQFCESNSINFALQRRQTFCGLLGGGAVGAGGGGDADSEDDELALYFWRQKGDAGRIAHRYAEHKWDAW